MRPAKFFFAVLFAGVFLVTLMKVLFFGLAVTAIFGSVFFLSRALRRFGGLRRGYGPSSHFAYQNFQGQPPFLGQQQSPFAQPLDPNWQPRQQAAPMGRRIEVL